MCARHIANCLFCVTMRSAGYMKLIFSVLLAGGTTATCNTSHVFQPKQGRFQITLHHEWV